MTLLPALSFARPWWLLALLPLGAALWLVLRTPHGSTRWLRVVDAHLLPHVLTGRSVRCHDTLSLALAGLLAVLALSGPVLNNAGERPATRRDSLRVLMVDLSPDAEPHLERIKLKLHALLARPDDGETALLAYAAEPYLIVPPTSDAAVIARFVPELAVDAMPVAGNHPREALRMATAVLARSSASARDIIWFTATEPSEGTMDSIPAGTRLSVLLAGNATPRALGETASRANGILLSMRADDSDLKTLADTLTTGRRTSDAARGTDLGPWLLLALLPLVALRFRRILSAVFPLLLCAALLPDTAHALAANDADARKLFDAGRYADAAARFSDSRWKAAAHYRAGRYDEAARLLEGHEDADSLYNRANALARLGRLQDALAGYEAVLRLRPDDADALYNRELVRRLLNNPDNAPKGGGGGSRTAPSPAAAEASRAAEQWMRGVPDDPGSLLKRKLQAEHRRRLAGEAERPW